MSLPLPEYDQLDAMGLAEVIRKGEVSPREALTAALHSEVRERLREDYHRFPPFTGRVGHYPMRRVRVTG